MNFRASVLLTALQQSLAYNVITIWFLNVRREDRAYGNTSALSLTRTQELRDLHLGLVVGRKPFEKRRVQPNGEARRL